MSAHYDIRLHGMASPDGEITLTDLASLADPLQELMRFLGRDVIGAAQRGRPSEYLTQLTELRLSSLEKGSTRLVLERGASGILSVPTEEWEALDERFWEVVEAVPTGRVPGWVTPAIADRAHRLIRATNGVATEVTFSTPGHRPVSWVSSQVSADPWKPASGTSTSNAEVSGILEAVDLNSQKFRIRDDVGGTVTLHNVDNADATAPLVGRRVLATGRGEYSAGKLAAVHDARLEPFPVPAEWTPGHRPKFFDIASFPPAPTGPAAEVTDEEFADIQEFLATL